MWKIFMPSGHAEYVLFYLHPVLKWRGYDPLSQINIYGIAKTAYLGRSASATLKMSTVRREKESTCSCLNCCSVLWSSLLHWFLSLRKEFISLGCFQKIHWLFCFDSIALSWSYGCCAHIFLSPHLDLMWVTVAVLLLLLTFTLLAVGTLSIYHTEI